jgi:hypothetical protein
VVAPGGEQLVLAGGSLLVQVPDPARDQPGGDQLALLRVGECGVSGLGDLGVGDPAAELVIPDRARVPDPGPGVVRDGGDGRGDLGVHVHGDREPGAGPADGAAERGGVIRRVRPDDDRPGAPGIAGRGNRLGGEGGGAAGGVRVPAAEADRGDHRRAQRRADGSGHRVQPADQQALALDLGVPEPGALLAVLVDPFLRRVDIDERSSTPARSPCLPHARKNGMLRWARAV